MGREERLMELLYWVWTLIANAGHGNWETQGSEWIKGAERWRDQWHKELLDD